MAAQASTIGAGSFDPDLAKLAMSAHPGKEPPIARGCGRERLGGKDPSDVVNNGGDVDVEVGVDPSDHFAWLVMHHSVGLPVTFDGFGTTGRDGRTGHRRGTTRLL